ncbi:transcriptional regulator [Siculibacillus lacustris]|uniref:Transcriptional regulator n=1 Tax=Siculibacillus lacustris TaxID=1549641 RepID=A0A4Q9VLT8_9HYPH|nr:metalloregulator ArsR/SmtB family transcription factor [Siculibacillus lacustris]TBW36463.1 transcriptional regulator [Siculibacillus lacustris]
MDIERLEANAERAASLLKSMGSPRRLLILCQLVEGEKGVGELEKAVGLSQSALSQHLAVLRHKGYVATRRSGQSIFYSLAGEDARRVLRTLYDIYCLPDEPPR